MIIVTIGEISRRITGATEVDEFWVHGRMREATAAGSPPGVHVRIREPGIDLNLSAGDTAAPGRAGYAPEPAEAVVLDLWRSRGLDHGGFSSGQLTSFLHQLQDLSAQKDARQRAGVKIGVRMATLGVTRP